MNTELIKASKDVLQINVEWLFDGMTSEYNFMTELQLGKKKRVKFTFSNESFATKDIIFDGAKITGLLYRYSIITKNITPSDKLRVRLSFFDLSLYSELAPGSKIAIPKDIKTISSKLIKVEAIQDFTVVLYEKNNPYYYLYHSTISSCCLSKQVE